MAAFPILDGIDALTIFADNDAAGTKAAYQCEKRWASIAEVVVATPDQAGFDVADVVSV